MNDVPEIDVAELKARMDAGASFQLLDVREAYELDICRLEAGSAVHIPLGDLAERTGELSREGEIVVFCRTGKRSAFAVEILRELGWEKAVNLRGGIMAWAEAYDPSMSRY